MSVQSSVDRPAGAGTATSAPTAAPGGRRQRSRGLVLALVLTAQLMIVLDASIVNIALPDLQSSLGFTPTGLSWVVNAYTLVFGGLLLLGARAGDLLGRRRVFLIGIGIFAAASLAGGFAEGQGLLLASRALQGVGAAMAAPSALALLMTMYPEARERTKALGYFTAVSIGGAALGLIAGGMLTEWASWRWVFFVNVPIGIAVLVGAIVAMSETPRRTGHFDLAGAVTSTLGTTGLVYGFVRAASDGWSDPLTIAAFAGGVILLASFIAVELRATSPITPLRLFADRERAVSYVARLLLVAGMMGMFFFLSQFLQDVLGYSALQSGLAFLPLTVMVFSASQLSARVLAEKLPTKWLIAGALSVSTLGLLWLTQLHADSSYLDLLFPLILFGLGNGLAFVPLTALSLRGVQPADAGAASGLVNVTQQVGGALGLAVLVTVFGAASRGAVPPVGATAAEAAEHAFVVGADRGFLVAAGFLAATVLLVLFAVRGTPRRSEARAEVTVPATAVPEPA
ncbi:DHA2 family efflux MFS transporter permease subunit [Nakamurella sp. YIM 132087]|uniref:DHA2 family efflux MFS transporter permease subunit n=1 Tax=Nakamurella alba TaxID=2665158 RepID=A0A7K1FF05_9ACTN|nr:MFS transporter [Nakamurella alba]MTD12695.1 DHA2 family efflux MFS transporter permease subunit [Nakamurella alba]